MFITILKLKPQLGKQREMIEILRFVEDQTHLENRCIDCGVFTPCLDGGPVLYLDQWLSKEDLNRHIQSPIFHDVLSAMELACEPPEISFHEISNTEGLKMIEALRMVKG
jgi:quinol monooxygenase YgiN